MRSRSFLDLVFFGFCMFCAYIRPRYQLSVYRTICPLVLCWQANPIEENLSGQWEFVFHGISLFND